MERNYKKNIALFLSSQAISLFGSSLVQYAIIWYITLSTKSGLMMTISTLCGFIPQIIISLFAGVWADKYNKKKMIIIADASIGFATLVMAILFLFGIDSIWLLFLVLIIRSFGSGVQSPTVNAFIPNLAPTDKLMKVNGINTTVQSIIMVLSPIASGSLLGAVPLSLIFFIDVVTAILAIIIVSFIKYDYVKENSDEKIDYFASIKEGMVYLKNHKLIKKMLNYNVLLSFLISPLAILTPLLVTRTFGDNPWFLTLNEISFFIGNIIGGVIISSWGGFKNKLYTIGLACVCSGISGILLGLSINFTMYLIVMGFCGLVMPMFNTPFVTLFQERVEIAMQGRVFSLYQIVSGSIMPLAMILFGPIADYIKIEYILVLTGILFIVLTIIFLNDKVLKNSYEEKEAVEV